ncbi:response regulator [Winogradskyella vincentii]|uniref:Response regulator n=1 Tax=Winogradskyella vincentii TaxID=2877122 RepID=A0ABS7Y394_9FLAO|nr:response regulator [Winogradskyella vincentii]MCA0153327.1 response regulator [Winogradskyella vincentii]
MTETKRKLLYVEDEKLNRMLFDKIFSKKYDVYIAESGEQGLDILMDHDDIPVVVSDLKMPHMDGLEFIGIAKNKHPQIKYFILTGFDMNEDIDIALKENLIHQYFMKPCNFNEIDMAIDNAMHL